MKKVRNWNKELKRQSKEEAQEFLNKLDAKKSSVEYATKDDVKRLEENLTLCSVKINKM